MDIQKAQADMRHAYFNGMPGVAVSGMVWLAAATVVWTQGVDAGVLTLFFGGMIIHPVSVLIARMLGRPGNHSRDNPLGRLAIEGTAFLLLGVALAYVLFRLHLNHFFSVMLVVIGGRYLTFQTLYGVRLYWICGIALAACGLLSIVTRAPTGYIALLGGTLEMVFAVLLYISKEGGARNSRV